MCACEGGVVLLFDGLLMDSDLILASLLSFCLPIQPSIKRTNTFADDGLTSEELASRAEKLLKQSRKNTASK
jgi:hypothetical protein